MVVVTKPHTPTELVEQLAKEIEELGVMVQTVVGAETAILGLIGDTTNIDIQFLESNDIVERVMKVQEPFKKANRKFHPENTVIDVCGKLVGGNHIAVVAGPCSVESEEQIVEIAKAVKAAGATFLRGGAFKPRTSPYAFQGLHKEGLQLLKKAKDATGLPIVTEIMSPHHIDMFEEYCDIVQVGARNMQNFELLKELGRMTKPILLKRGLANTLEEFLMSAEYVMAGGNENVILCERGIRTYETYTRNTLDISAVPALKKLSHLPVVIDPSHAAGIAWMVEPLAKAALAAGADGLMIEVHNNPHKALSDGAQSITPDAFTSLMKKLRAIAEVEGRTI